MAKTPTTKRAARHQGEVDLPAAAAAAPQIPIIKVTPADSLEVLVDVGPMTVPYTVAFDGSTLIKSLVDRMETVPVAPGSRLLAWAFAHTEKAWSHSIGYRVNGGAVKVLESRSEKDKDNDHSVGVAIVERT